MSTPTVSLSTQQNHSAYFKIPTAWSEAFVSTVQKVSKIVTQFFKDACAYIANAFSNINHAVMTKLHLSKISTTALEETQPEVIAQTIENCAFRSVSSLAENVLPAVVENQTQTESVEPVCVLNVAAEQIQTGTVEEPVMNTVECDSHDEINNISPDAAEEGSPVETTQSSWMTVGKVAKTAAFLSLAALTYGLYYYHAIPGVQTEPKA